MTVVAGGGVVVVVGMSHFSYRHCKSSATITSSPPPTIRVTSPVPDAINVINIWDPEVSEDLSAVVNPPPRHKSYTFCFVEEDEEDEEDDEEEEAEEAEEEEDVSPATIVDESGSRKRYSDLNPHSKAELVNSSQSDDDGLRTAGESGNSSDADEADEQSRLNAPPEASGRGLNPPKKVKFTRSLSLAPCGSKGKHSAMAAKCRRHSLLDASGMTSSAAPICDAQDHRIRTHPVVLVHHETQYNPSGKLH